MRLHFFSLYKIYTAKGEGNNPELRGAGALRSECKFRAASGILQPEPARLAAQSSSGGVQMILVSRWAADESGSVLCPPELCLPKQRNAWHTSKPAAVSSPELAAWNCAFVGLPSSVWVRWLCWALSFWLLSPWENSWSNYCKKGQLTNPRKREPVMCFLFRFQHAQSPSAAGNKTELISA